MDDTSAFDTDNGRNSDPPEPYNPAAPRPGAARVKSLPDIFEDDGEVTQPNLPPILPPGLPAQWT